MKEKEIWKPLKIYSGEYAVSSLGRVMSLKYGKKRILKPSINSAGYPTVSIYFKGKRCTRTVHGLVAAGFDILTNGLQVNHVDGIKSNNNLNNLEACTGSYNTKHCYRMGLNSSAKINMETANKIRKEVSNGKKQIVVCREYKLSRGQVSSIVSNRYWVLEKT